MAGGCALGLVLAVVRPGVRERAAVRRGVLASAAGR